MKSRARITLPLTRDLVMLGLGTGGMIHDLFFAPIPSLVRIGASLLLILGSASLNASWIVRWMVGSPPPPPETSRTGSRRSPSRR